MKVLLIAAALHTIVVHALPSPGLAALSSRPRTLENAATIETSSGQYNANKPEAYANEPAAYANEPSTRANKPVTYANKPATHAKKPATYANKPATHANKPVTHANKPATHANKPATHANKPATHAQTAGKGKPHFSPGAHVDTRITAEEAARGGSVVKSATFTLPAAKPAQARHQTTEFEDYNPCDHNILHEEVEFVGETHANLIKGHLHDVSDVECPPGTISHAYSFTTTWSVSGQVGPDLKELIPKSNPLGKNLDKFGVRFGIQYSWTNTQTTTYTASETGKQSHPFVLVYRPQIMVVTGKIQKTTYVHPFKQYTVCDVSHPTSVSIHVPVHNNDDCSIPETSCGPAVGWDHCFFIGDYAKDFCPDRNLGPTPEKGRQCPISWYPPQYRNRDGAVDG